MPIALPDEGRLPLLTLREVAEDFIEVIGILQLVPLPVVVRIAPEPRAKLRPCIDA